MTDEQKAGKIYAAIVEIMRSVGAIGKDSKNEQQNYKYRGAEAVYNRVQPLFATHGIFSVPQLLELHEETGQSKSGGTMHFAWVKMRYTFFAEDGSSVVVEMPGGGMDSGDKAIPKAVTIAHRYAICQLLQIPFAVEDPEQHSPEWSSRLNGGITLKQYTDVKRAWWTTHPAEGKTPSQLALAFADWVWNSTGGALTSVEVGDWRNWKQTDVDACMSALEPKQGD